MSTSLIETLMDALLEKSYLRKLALVKVVHSERSIEKTETRDKYPEEAVNTGNAEQQGPDNKKKIRTEPGKDHEQQLVIKGKGKGKGKGQSNFHKERTSLENKTYQIKEQQARELDTI